eukprot:CAMPEP_0198238094 /NCGR_PEP_ID=MMETSP1446-20131203/3817_1 /TAXON_ID=1461542 ORGANISM="Unidentified sp, Strain CCMP2111" /NCGR_SAMPLE_ID=MMETSP1446 /ASSEMBLY_ACC=CAM_ASM_001112 /LENGTH=739 /DNA_ID=CAMNT_0043920431 /DNA_START=50 /DNA_END=2269 /DNA_ORIENTATION=-
MTAMMAATAPREVASAMRAMRAMALLMLVLGGHLCVCAPSGSSGEAAMPTLQEIQAPYKTNLNKTLVLEAAQELLDNKQVIPPFANDSSVKVWEQPLESFYLPSPKDFDTISLGVLVVHEVLTNMSLYGTDEVFRTFLDLGGEEALYETAITLFETYVPTREQLLVRMQRTDYVNVVFEAVAQEFNKIDPSQGLDPKKLISGVVNDPQNEVLKKLSIVAGPNLGPILTTMLKSSFPPTNETDASGNGTESGSGWTGEEKEKLDAFLEALSTTAIKVMLFAPAFPSPCFRGDPSCPPEQRSDPLIEIRNRVLNGTFNVSDPTLQKGALDLISKQLGLEELLGQGNNDDPLKKILGDKNATADLIDKVKQATGLKRATTIMSDRGPPDNTYYDYMANLSAGNYSVDIASSLTDAGFKPETAVCMANLSAAMYENEATIKQWADGLGVEEVVVSKLGDRYASQIGFFVDNSTNTVIVALEGIPLISTFFFRGLFQWLNMLLNDKLVPYKYPCEGGTGEGQSSSPGDLCSDLMKKYPNASVFEVVDPVMGEDTASSALIDGLDKALDALSSNGNSEKPGLYVTGSSGAGATSRNTMVEILLRGYGDSFDSERVFLYTFSGPSVGNGEYDDMVEELFKEESVKAFPLVNKHDYIPYFPMRPQPFAAYQFNGDDATLEPYTLNDSSYQPGPANIIAGFILFHDTNGQVLPLTRTLVEDYAPECDFICVRGTCGYFQCKDSCDGAL